MVSLSETEAPRRPARRVALMAALFVAQIAAIGLIFKHVIAFDCLENWPAQACGGALVALYCMLGAVGLLALLKPAPFRDLLAQAGRDTWPIGVNLAGFGVALIPVSFMNGASGAGMLLPAFGFWTLGMVLLLGGVVRYLAPLAVWATFIRSTRTQLLPAVLTGLIAPFFASQIRPLWQVDTLAAWTFHGVEGSLRARLHARGQRGAQDYRR